ncbi:MAG: GEVED domain-containing protein [Candidatus Krumholzibacteriales bacterium]
MRNKLSLLFMCLLCLLLSFSILHTQEMALEEPAGKSIYLIQENLPSNVIDLQTFLQSGEIQTVSEDEILPPGITPGPAPDPYPTIDMKEKGIEQLGASADDCDGIWFVNANLWLPNKWALVWWDINIPNASSRLASEFEKDLTVSLWVDWNQDNSWGQNEKMICESINLQDYFPTDEAVLKISYMTMFLVPDAALLYGMSEGNERLETKVWARGVLSYDDPDTSPDGECIYGEYEDFEINYFEILKKTKDVKTKKS